MQRARVQSVLLASEPRRVSRADPRRTRSERGCCEPDQLRADGTCWTLDERCSEHECNQSFWPPSRGAYRERTREGLGPSGEAGSRTSFELTAPAGLWMNDAASTSAISPSGLRAAARIASGPEKDSA